METGNKLISQFVAAYGRDIDFYKSTALRIRDRVEHKFKQEGIKHVIRYRAKDPSSLRKKLLERDQKAKDEGKRGYRNESDIDADITDLVGIEISLVNIDDAVQVSEVLKGLYHVLESIKHTGQQNQTELYQIQIPGYIADHYRVKLQNPGRDIRRQKLKFEIQVKSVFIYGWAESEHDIIYKHGNGKPSENDISIAKMMNCLAGASIIGAQQLGRNHIKSSGGADSTAMSQSTTLRPRITSDRSEDFFLQHLARTPKQRKMIRKNIDKATHFQANELIIGPIKRWLEIPGRSLLWVLGPTAPDDDTSTVISMEAFTATTKAKISYFCDPNTSLSPKGIFRELLYSLIKQLVQWHREFGREDNVRSLDFSNLVRNPELYQDNILLFRTLLRLMPPDEILFCIIDGIPSSSDTSPLYDWFFEALHSGGRQLCMKLLVTTRGICDSLQRSVDANDRFDIMGTPVNTVPLRPSFEAIFQDWERLIYERRHEAEFRPR